MQSKRSECAGPTEHSACSEATERLAKIYRALGHPARLTILKALAEKPDACCGDIVETLPLAQSTVSQHLQVLKEAGLLTCCTRGRCCHYGLDPAVLEIAAKASHDFLLSLADRSTGSGELPLAHLSATNDDDKRSVCNAGTSGEDN
ncbi:ArsR/SmtB family transcription factor [Roseibium sp.]|uniref:ArsR/SmtB family transcription factor n=1 Tax=Roseibium sp. TaxID=1936156 RepID=UPI003A97C29B